MGNNIFDISNLTEEELNGSNEFMDFDLRDLAKAIVESSIGEAEEE